MSPTVGAAIRSLARGGGPADGAFIACRAEGAESADCGDRSNLIPTTPAPEAWQNASLEDGANGLPAASAGGSMTFDAFDGVVLYFGGGASGRWENETWSFTGSLWHNLTAKYPHAPPAGGWSAMDYDGAYDVVLLYGGCTASTCPDNATWDFTLGAGWKDLTPLLSPSSPALMRAALAFAPDPQDNVSVLYGGCLDANCSSVSNATYAFDGFGWIQVPTPFPPPPSAGASLAYDPQIGALVLFGGCTATSCDENQSWTFSSLAWSNATSKFGTSGATPPARGYAALTWDEHDDALILFGGLDGGHVWNDTWALQCVGAVCGWSNQTAAGASVPGLWGASVPSVSNASTGTFLFGGALHASPPTALSGPVSNGTFFLEPILSVTAIVPANASIPTTVNLTSNATGGSEAYGGFPDSLHADWWFASTEYPGFNVTVPVTIPGNQSIVLTVYDHFGVSVTDRFILRVTGVLSSIEGANDTDVGIAVNLSASPPQGGDPPYTYQWTFGDGGTGVGATVAYAWSAPGDYPVNLTVRDIRGLTFNATAKVDVVALPTITLYQSRAPVDVGVSVLYNVTVDGGTAPLAYLWSFVFPGSSSTSSSAEHAFTRAGTFVTNLTVTDAVGATSERPITEIVNSPLGGTASASSPSVNTSKAESFVARPAGGTAPYALSWEFGDGTGGAGAAVSHQYEVPGNYTARVWINDSGGDNFSVPVTVHVTNATTGSNPGGSNPKNGVPRITTWEWLALAGVAAVVILELVLLLRHRGRSGRRPPIQPTAALGSSGQGRAGDATGSSDPNPRPGGRFSDQGP